MVAKIDYGLTLQILLAENWTDNNSLHPGNTGPHYLIHYKGWKQT
jgi:hypothetical protein